MIKKGFVLIIALVVICNCVCSGLAEEESGGLFGSIGSFFSSAWDDVSDWTETAWDDATSWVETAWDDAASWTEGAWGDASSWVTKAWNDTASWATDIWGDVSTWTTEAYSSASESVSTWWVETFSTVTDTSKDVWVWLQETASGLSTEKKAYLERINAIISSGEETTDEAVEELFDELLNEMGITGSDVEKVWQSVKAYAENKGISALEATKLSLPYLFQLAVDEQSELNRDIPPIAIAQYLTGIIEKLGVESNEIADKLIISLHEVLGEIK